MKTYLVTSGLLFVVILIAHIARFFAEGPGIATEPTFVISSALSIGMTGWALWLFRSYPVGAGDTNV